MTRPHRSRPRQVYLPREVATLDLDHDDDRDLTSIITLVAHIDTSMKAAAASDEGPR
jgi:hypothetical protein